MNEHQQVNTLKLASSELFLDFVEGILAAKWVDCLETTGDRRDFEAEHTAASPSTLRLLL
jgi:hypothetical protein